LYIFIVNADIISVLFWTISIYLLLTFPIFVNFYGYYATKENKAFFGVDIFGIIKIVSGYAQIIKEGICIHINDKKAVIIPFQKILGLRKSFKPLKDFHIVRANLIVELSGAVDFFYPLSCIFTINYFVNSFGFYLSNIKPYVKLRSTTTLNLNRDYSDFLLNFTVILNLLMVIISFIKILMEKIIYASRKRKQNQYSR